MIIVTGAAGFIGSYLIKQLNTENFNTIIAVDQFDDPNKSKNWKGLKIQEKVDRKDFFIWIEKNYELVEFIFHIGARTNTSEFDTQLLDVLNTQYSKDIWKCCVNYQIPLVYASSAATYGLGEMGYDDDESIIPQLKPLNPYGQSKQDFDVWALLQKTKPFFWAGLKFFNVYGPHESHKGRMASVVWHAYNQIQHSGAVTLFRSHHPEFNDGEQKRDFVYVKDVVAVCLFFMKERKGSGIYNLGSGQTRTFIELSKAVFQAMEKKPSVQFIDTPIDIRSKYQYFTEAKMDKLKGIGYTAPFHSLEEGITNYIKHYLSIE